MKRMEFKIDYFSVTFPLMFDIGDVEEIAIDDKVELVGEFFNLTERLIKKEPRATNRYKVQYTLGENITLRLAGPLDSYGSKTCHLELKGEGCREFETRCPEKTWVDLMTFCNMLDAKATRIDIAIDDYSNQLELNWLDKKLDNKYFISSIKNDPRPIGRYKKGFSVTLGSNDSPLQICIYDKKSEQLGRNKFVQEQSWTRYEMRYRGDKAKLLYSLLYKNLRVNKDNLTDAFKKMSLGLLYKNLDIKEDNNYDVRTQYKVSTDKKWLDFIENAEKVVLPPLPKRDVSIEKYLLRHKSTVAFYMYFMYFINGKDKEALEHEMFQTMRDELKLNRKKFHRLNLYLDKLGIKTLDDNDLDNLYTEINDIVIEKELPF